MSNTEKTIDDKLLEELKKIKTKMDSFVKDVKNIKENTEMDDKEKYIRTVSIIQEMSGLTGEGNE